MKKEDHRITYGDAGRGKRKTHRDLLVGGEFLKIFLTSS